MYKFISVAKDLIGCAGSASFIATSKEEEKAFRNSILISDGVRVAQFRNKHRKRNVVTECFCGINCYGHLTITTMTAQSLEEFCGIVLESDTCQTK